MNFSDETQDTGKSAGLALVARCARHFLSILDGCSIVTQARSFVSLLIGISALIELRTTGIASENQLKTLNQRWIHFVTSLFAVDASPVIGHVNNATRSTSRPVMSAGVVQILVLEARKGPQVLPLARRSCQTQAIGSAIPVLVSILSVVLLATNVVYQNGNLWTLISGQ